MCLAIPGKLIKKDREKGLADLGGVTREVMLSFLPEAKEGDWILIHTGFGISVISEQEAGDTIRILNEGIKKAGL